MSSESDAITPEGSESNNQGQILIITINPKAQNAVNAAVSRGPARCDGSATAMPACR